MMEMIEYYNNDDPENIQHYFYKTIQWEFFDQEDTKYFPIGSKITKNSPYIDIGSGFDIETTNIPNEHKATMYIWQFSLNDLVIYGRSWFSYQNFLQFIINYYNLNAKKKLLCFIHNMPFEFSFIKRLIRWDIGKEGWPKVFALDARNVVKAEYQGIEFRDSAILTQLSLAKLAKDYGLKYQKLVGDLDYSVIRFGGEDPTPLNKKKELPYCFNDVLILSSFFNEYIKPEYIKKKIKIPLTATGVPRDQMKRNFKKMNRKEKYIHESQIRKAFPSFELYKIMIEWLYRGGYTHSDPSLTDEVILYSLGSVDLKSAYPAILLQELYGYQFVECSVDIWPRMLDKRITKEESFFGEFTFYNIESKGKISYESKNKCLSYSGARWDNGRLWKADSVTVWLTEYDLQIYSLVYNFESVKCHKLYKSVKKELPEFVKDLILEFYYIKESMNKFGKDSIERLNAKKKLNAIYGMMVTSLYFMEYHFNEETGEIESIESGKTYDELIEKQLLLPQWGIYCTAAVRLRLIENFIKCKGDAIYSDTDSIKVKNYDANAYIFEDFNNRIRRINKTMYVGKYDREIFKDLGTFDYEGKMFKFKALGCKRYLNSKAKFNKKTKKYYLEHESTVAGMKKGTLQAYCKANNLDIYDSFTNGLCLDLSFSKKLTSIYTDEPFEAELTDYRGHTSTIHEESCVALVEIPFKLTMDHVYIAFLEEIKKMNQNRLVKRNYGGML